MNLVADLKQRKLVQWSVAYVAAAFALLQGIDIVATRFTWPDVIERVLIIACCVGFFITLLLAWYHGERGYQKVTKTELLLLAVLLGIGGLVLWKFAQRSPSAAAHEALVRSRPAVAVPINPRSIAVLPFANLSADKDNAYFAEGIQDEILTRLSKIAELKVISRTSTMRYASSPDNLPEIARTLGVATILEGSVEKVGNAVRINVQLIKADTDTHLWAEMYDRKLVDVFTIQSEVTTAIAKSLQATLTSNEKQDVAAKLTSNTAAYDAYLRGLAADRVSIFSPEPSAQARDAFQEAVRLDPHFAEAWRRLTQVLSEKYQNERQTPDALAAMKQAADTTARLQPGSINAQLAQAYYRYRGLHDYPGALVAFSSIAQREPNNIEALAAMAYIERRLGDMDGAIRQLAKAEELDPANPQIVFIRADILLGIRRFPEAFTALGQAQHLLPPHDEIVLARLVEGYQALGNLRAAEKALAGYSGHDLTAENLRLNQAWLENQPDRFEQSCRQLGVFLDAHPDLSGPGAKLICQLQNAYLLHLRGKQLESRAVCQSVLETLSPLHVPDMDYRDLATRGMAQACLGNKSAALSDLGSASALADRDAGDAPYAELGLAQSQLWLGDSDAAIALLTHSLSVPYGTTKALMYLDPFWQPLRNDSRFNGLIAK
jgi:TolB-like protein/Flp pilus assembly protein TadD